LQLKKAIMGELKRFAILDSYSQIS